MLFPTRDQQEGLPDWIMSYADMITILMAFFVVMYAMAGHKDSAKEEAVFKSLRQQFGMVAPGWGALVAPVFAHHPSSPIDGHGRKAKGPRAIPRQVAHVEGTIYFADDRYMLNPAQEKTLRRAAGQMDGLNRIEIRGHTSSEHGKNGKPRDSWDLAYARCRSTMEYLVSLGIDPQRIRLGVAAQYEPPDARPAPAPTSDNGRVEVLLLDEAAPPQEAKIEAS